MPGETLSSPFEEDQASPETSWDTLKETEFKGALDPNVLSNPFDAETEISVPNEREVFNPNEAVAEALDGREEQTEDRRRFEEQLTEIKDLLDRAKNRLDESSSGIDELNHRLDQIFEEKRFDEDELAYLRSNLYNAAEELYAASAKFDQTNQEYEAFVVQKKDQFSDADYRIGRISAEENDDRVKAERRKAAAAEDRCAELRNLLSRLEELNRMSRF